MVPLDFLSFEGEDQTDIIMLSDATRERKIDTAIAGIEALSAVEGRIIRLLLEELQWYFGGLTHRWQRECRDRPGATGRRRPAGAICGGVEGGRSVRVAPPWIHCVCRRRQ